MTRTIDSLGATRWRPGVKADICWTFDAGGYKAMLKRALSD